MLTRTDFWNLAMVIGNDFAHNPKLRKRVTKSIAHVCKFSNHRFSLETFENAIEEFSDKMNRRKQTKKRLIDNLGNLL